MQSRLLTQPKGLTQRAAVGICRAGRGGVGPPSQQEQQRGRGERGGWGERRGRGDGEERGGWADRDGGRDRRRRDESGPGAGGYGRDRERYGRDRPDRAPRPDDDGGGRGGGGSWRRRDDGPRDRDAADVPSPGPGVGAAGDGPARDGPDRTPYGRSGFRSDQGPPAREERRAPAIPEADSDAADDVGDYEEDGDGADDVRPSSVFATSPRGGRSYGRGDRDRYGGYERERRGPPPLRDSFTGEALYGVFPVLAALRAGRRKVHKAFLQEGIDLNKRKDAGLLRQVESLCRDAGVEVVKAPRHELNLMSGDRPHQGLVLDVSPLDWMHLDEFPTAAEAMAAARAAGAAGPPVWLALDEVVDPQNLGAVVRSAYCLGATGVLACSRNCAPLSAVVSKASAGALEALPLHNAHSLPRTLLDARDSKGWAVLGAAAGSGSVPVGAAGVRGPTILVLGSEGFGLRTNVRRACSGLVRVDMAAATRGGGGGGGGGISGGAAGANESALRGLVDSLNVSVAAGILLHSLIQAAAAAGTAGTPEQAAEAAGPGAAGAIEG
ncbi:hypothetical protein HYH03_003744 [Edaphochlamys debaryana]|uniref:rRNA methyltransferase 1, mitochondrial n=1 Tax=Edaphochlamys debaryana TaxID=47281 RepID=A0A836C476_9CHLO|nr:hypothetical protein HYH03_003744 [Edaphochlamys debaryana]|eukprot:KAG2498492.1 hypothetical protein HYH03_003744 [Edaphochlamys debaryana]